MNQHSLQNDKRFGGHRTRTEAEVEVRVVVCGVRECFMSAGGRYRSGR